MILKSIDILNFKNIAAAKLDFSPGVNCLVGLNGMGKSNILEAIHFLSMARPMGSMPESALIRHGQEMLLVKGEYEMESGSGESVACGIVKGKGKSLKRNGKEYQKLSMHIGSFPVVAVTPADSQIVTGSGETRRRLMDMVISQAHPSYLSHLIKYNRGLDSRNKMLRAGVRDSLLYESIEAGMEETAQAIYTFRREWTDWISAPFREYYSMISGDAEYASVDYRSVIANGPLREALDAERGRDAALGFTSNGIHRDDLNARLGNYSMRRLGSQGQVKSFIIALRLAIFDYLRESSKIMPVLLLDDIFDKLDASRVERIMQLVSGSGNFGQIFITDTNRQHLHETIAGIEGDSLLLNVKEGEFTPITI